LTVDIKVLGNILTMSVTWNSSLQDNFTKNVRCLKTFLISLI